MRLSSFFKKVLLIPALCFLLSMTVWGGEEPYFFLNFQNDLESFWNADDKENLLRLVTDYPLFCNQYLLKKMREALEPGDQRGLSEKIEGLLQLNTKIRGDDYLNDLWVQYKSWTPEEASKALSLSQGEEAMEKKIDTALSLNDTRSLFEYKAERIREKICKTSEMSEGAEFESALAELEDLSQDSDLPVIQQIRALWYLRNGRYKAALEELAEADAFYGTGKDPISQARVQFQEGEIHAKTGYFEKATEIYEKSLKVFRTSGIDEEHASVTTSLGNISLMKRDVGNAEKYFEDALSIYERLRNQEGQAKVLNNLGVVCQRQGKDGEALNHLEKSMDLAKKSGNFNQQAETGNNLGSYYLTHKDYDKAIQGYKEAITAGKRIGDIEVEIKALHNMGIAFYFQGKKENALSSISESLAMSRRLESLNDALESSFLLGKIYRESDSGQKAEEYLKLAKDYAKKTNNSERLKEIEKCLNPSSLDK